MYLSFYSALSVGGGGQIHMRLWIEIGKVCSSCPTSNYLRRGNDISWEIDFVPGVGKEVLYDGECGAPADIKT